MTTLTGTLRDEILKKVLRHRYEADDQAHRAKVNRLSLVLYNAIYCKAERDAMNALPEGFMPHGHEISVEMTKGDNYKGYSYIKLHLGQALPIASKHQHGVRIKGMNDHPAVINLDQAYRDQAAAEKVKDSVKSQIKAVLESATTVNKLREAWPEVEPFLPAPPAKRSQMLAPTSLNDALKLPVKKMSLGRRSRQCHDKSTLAA